MADPVTLAIEVGLMLASMALTASQKIYGPRLKDLNVSLADYGSPIPRFWGTRRINPQTIWAEKLHEKKHHTKTKGGKYTEYKYFGTWAVLICDHEIDAVSRIWFDKRLVYDRTGTGPISIAALLGDGSEIKLSQGGNMRIYYGTEDQTPDPRMEAWCEDRYGADSCPAYKGSAYIVFEEIPLEQVGNRIPQITVEAVNNPTNAYPYEQVSDGGSLGYTAPYTISPTGNWLTRHYLSSVNILEWYDVATRQKMGESLRGDLELSVIANVALAADGTAYWYGTDHDTVQAALFSCPPVGAVSRTILDAPTAFASGPCRVFDVGVRTILGGTDYATTTGYLNGTNRISNTQCARDFCIDADDNIWALFEPVGSSNQFTLTDLTGGGGSNTITGLVTRTHPADPAICHVAGFNHFFVVTDGKFYTIDDSTFAIKTSGAWSGDTNNIPYNNPNRTSVWSAFTEKSLEDGSVIRSLTATNWIAEDVSAVELYDPVNHAIWSHPQVGTHSTVRYLDRIGSAGVTLADVVDSVSTWCGLTGQDTTQLTQTVLGYSVTQGTGKDMIEHLLDIHDVDARPHDFAVQFLNRGTAPSGTIATANFARDGKEARYVASIQQDTDIPRRLTINFADNDHDQQSNNVIAQRPLDSVGSSREETIDLSTYADTPDSAQQKADRYLRRLWNSRERIQVKLTPQQLALEPGDVKTISLDGSSRNARLDKLTITPTALETEWVRDETSFAAVNSATTGPDMGGRDPEIIYVPAQTKGFILDIPFVQDADNDLNPVVYAAAGGYNDPWPGAFVYRGDSGTYDEQFAVIETSREATWGLTTDTLATANPWLWDRGNSVNVTIYNGTPTSTTEAAIDADPTLNLAAIGTPDNYEIINFTTATLEANGTYTLSGFKRGRRGTEWARTTHAVGDEFILLDNALPEGLGSDDIGDDLSFKAVTAGRNVASAVAIDLDDYGASCFKPYAPGGVKGTQATTGDWTFTWSRRTRIGGTWNGSTIPLSEDSESYEIDIMNGSSVVRTISAATTTATYTNAQQVTDFGSGQSTVSYRIHQLSATVGRGFRNSGTLS